MIRNRALVEKRVHRTLTERVRPACIDTLSNLDVSIWRVPNSAGGIVSEPCRPDENSAFEHLDIGSPWGQAWQTVWFSCTATIPQVDAVDLRPNDRIEAIVDLGWADHSAGFQCEGLVRSAEGVIVKAINPRNQWIPLPQPSDARAKHTFTIEAAANPILLDVHPFLPTPDGDKLTASREPLYRLAEASVVHVHHNVRQLSLDLEFLYELLAAQDEYEHIHWVIADALTQALDVLDLDNIVGTADDARAILAPVLAQPALPTAHHIYAVGHAHIDTAWLWPLAETHRKVARTFANVLRLIEDGTGLIFALPAAQHMAWLREDEPELFARIQKYVAQGSIIPVGGMWVEPDAVLPGGEALCRQLVTGISFFREAFGRDCQEIWLPDSFGYSAALPQIAREAGISRFLTQKISWNQSNKFPHHTLLWEGIDGSRIYTHFPPADTYGSDISGEQIKHSVENFKEAGQATCSLLPFGYGDGGGGPTREMLEKIKRYEDFVAGPRIELASPHDFFDRAQEEYPEPPVWVGELYLELHRGTLTSQILAKQGNRRSEALLREAELWCATAAHCGVMDYPYEELDAAWKSTLLCQFHDILPGTSIAWVYREVRELHSQIAHTCHTLTEKALHALSTPDAPRVCTNSSSFEMSGVAPLSAGVPNSLPHDSSPNDVRVHGVSVSERELSNGVVTLRFDDDGACESLIARGVEYVPSGQRAGVFYVHQDFPNMWDAWDIDQFYRGSEKELKLCIAEHGVAGEGDGSYGFVRADASTERSRMQIEWRLYLGRESVDVHVVADWHDSEKLLKLAFPVDIHTDRAQYETQMGYIERSTHTNTSWDEAKFEVSAHRWLRLHNASRALAIANDATYGWDITRHSAGERATFARVRATLVKSARYPDPHQDQGRFEWNFRIRPHATVEEAVCDGQQINLPVRTLRGQIEPLVKVDGGVVESLALAPDKSGDIVIRIYEATGGPSKLCVQPRFACTVYETNLLYEAKDVGVCASPEQPYIRELSAFQITTLRLSSRGVQGKGEMNEIWG